MTTSNASGATPPKKKTSVSETGHAKNVTNFQSLIAFVNGYGANYNPSKTALKLPELIALKTEADAKLNEVIAKNTAYNVKVNERVAAFSDLKTLATRLINALQATDAAPETIKDAKGFNRKMQGKRAASLTATPIDPNEPAPATISSSQQSFTQQMQHFAGLLAVLESEPSYAPNETDLKLPTLIAKRENLNAVNDNVATAYTNISNARLQRNKTLYAPENSVYDTASEVKKYVKSVFGATSPEFEQIKGLEFKNRK